MRWPRRELLRSNRREAPKATLLTLPLDSNLTHMSHRISARTRASLVLFAILFSASSFSLAGDDQKPPAQEATPPKPAPFPPDASTQQSITLDGKALHYTVTIGSLPVRNREGVTTPKLSSPPIPCLATTGP